MSKDFKKRTNVLKVALLIQVEWVLDFIEYIQLKTLNKICIKTCHVFSKILIKLV